jgi:hypothetical protein
MAIKQHLPCFISLSMIVVLSLSGIRARPIDLISVNYHPSLAAQLTRPNTLETTITILDFLSDSHQRHNDKEGDMVGQIININRRSPVGETGTSSSSSSVRGLLQPEQPFETSPSLNTLSSLLSDLDNGKVAGSNISNAGKEAKKILQPDEVDVKTGLPSATDDTLANLLASLNSNSKNAKSNSQGGNSSSGSETFGANTPPTPPQQQQTTATNINIPESSDECMD